MAVSWTTIDPGWTRRRYAALVALLGVGQVLLWSLAIGLTYRAPEVDSAEQFVWAFSMEGGYWKHPPLPSWIMHGLLQLFGPSVALPVVAAQASIVIALGLTWRLGCEFMSPRRSLIATALTSLVTYHNIAGDSFNHNTVLLAFQAAMVLFFFLATRRGSWTLWALAGLFAGLSMLVKYVALVPLAGMLLYFALDRSLHHRRALLGLLLATAVFGLVLIPHVRWLVATDFMPFRYAHSVAKPLPGIGAALENVGGFALTQVLRVLPFLFGLWLVMRSRHADLPDAELGNDAMSSLPARDLLFIRVAALSPLVITMAIGVFGETGLAGRWGANAFLLAGHLVLVSLHRRDSASMLRWTLKVVVLVQILMCAGQTLGKTVFADRFHIRARANFPGAVLARQVQETWRTHTDAPLRLVATDIWLGGNLILNGVRPLEVLTDGSFSEAPWVKQDAVRTCGVLILEDVTHQGATCERSNAGIYALLARADATGTWTLPWHLPVPESKDPARSVIHWGIIAPESDRGCVLDSGK